MGHKRLISLIMAVSAGLLLMSASSLGQDDMPTGEWDSDRLEFDASIFPASVIGTDSVDTIEIVYSTEDAKLDGMVNGLVTFRLPFDYCNEESLESSSEVRVIRVFAGAGEDKIRVEIPHSQCPCEILAGSGDDLVEVNGCTGGNVHGDAGDDEIHIREHNVELRIYGDSGEDRVEIEDITSTWVDQPTIGRRDSL